MKRFLLSGILLLLLGGLSAQNVAGVTRTAFYLFNGNAGDKSGYSNQRTVVGAILIADCFGADGSADGFNGSSGCISGPSLMKSNLGGNAFQYRVTISSASIKVENSNPGNAASIFDTLSFDAWYMVASTFNKGKFKASLDGEFISEGKRTGPINQDSKTLGIGLDVWGETECFHDKIDGIRIFSRATRNEEIVTLFNGNSASLPDDNLAVSKKVLLSPNCPNPFNTSTDISWPIPKEAHVILKVFDFTGREVKALVDAEMAAGEQLVKFDVAGLTAGVHFYQLQANAMVETNEIVMIKSLTPV